VTAFLAYKIKDGLKVPWQLRVYIKGYSVDTFNRDAFQRLKSARKWPHGAGSIQRLSQQSFVSKGEVALRSRNDVVEYLDFKQLSTVPQSSGEFNVRLTRLKISRRMVVRQNDSAGIGLKSSREDETWICNSPGKTTS
jgi:hypothetical protein